MNDSLESTFVEKNWKMQSKFVYPEGRGRNSGKEPILKDILTLISFMSLIGTEILPSILNSVFQSSRKQ